MVRRGLQTGVPTLVRYSHNEEYMDNEGNLVLEELTSPMQNKSRDLWTHLLNSVPPPPTTYGRPDLRLLTSVCLSPFPDPPHLSTFVRQVRGTATRYDRLVLEGTPGWTRLKGSFPLRRRTPEGKETLYRQEGTTNDVSSITV